MAISSLEIISKNRNKKSCHLVNLIFFRFIFIYFAAL